jgi:hypothetical protein
MTTGRINQVAAFPRRGPPTPASERRGARGLATVQLLEVSHCYVHHILLVAVRR